MIFCGFLSKKILSAVTASEKISVTADKKVFIRIKLVYNETMKNELETLRQGIQKMEIVTVQAACQATGLSRQQVIDFVTQDKSLRIFDESKGVWINETAAGHC